MPSPDDGGTELLPFGAWDFFAPWWDSTAPSRGGNPLTDLFRFVEQSLLADPVVAALVGDRVFEAQASQDAEYPFVRFTNMSAPVRVGNGARTGMTRPLLRIEAVGHTEDLYTLEDLAGRIDALFKERAKGVAGATTISGSHIERYLTSPETPDGSVYRRLGGEYRFFIFRTE